MMHRLPLVFCLLIWSVVCVAQTATMDAPDEVPAGSKVAVNWDGPGETYSRITVHPVGADPDARPLASASITGGKNPVQISMPEIPGEYELRYFDAATRSNIGARSIRVVAVEIELSSLDAVGIGAQVEASWTGHHNTYDQIQIHPVAAADDAKALVTASITSRAKSVRLKAPEVAGGYEIRFVTAKEKQVLARKALSVVDVVASLTAPDRASSGEQIDVFWEGPGNTYDLIAVYPVAAADDGNALVTKSITSQANPIKLRLPEMAGAFELRYLLSKSKRVLARRSIMIGDVSAALTAPDQALAASRLAVYWEGPGNHYDRIDLHPEGATDDSQAVAGVSITSKANPLTLQLPAESGNYELRYITAQSKQVLARRPLSIQPEGRLQVVFEREGEVTQHASTGAVELILDASGSMLQRLGDQRRIEIARKVLTEIVNNHLPAEQAVALRVFGHRTPNACQSDLEVPLAPLERTAMVSRIAEINAMNLAKTPIADSLAQVPRDLVAAKGSKSVISITDGEETCDGDPAAVIADLRAQGLDVQVSVVGFAIDDPALKAEFQRWAEIGGGSYFDADSAQSLLQSLRTVISGPYRVLTATGEEVGRGIIGGAEIVLPAGVYQIVTVGPKPQVLDAVRLSPGELTIARF